MIEILLNGFCIHINIFTQSWQETNKVLVLGRSVHPPIRIEPYTGVEEAEARERLDRVKAERVSRFLWDAKTIGLKVRRVYAKTSITSKFLSCGFFILVPTKNNRSHIQSTMLGFCRLCN